MTKISNLYTLTNYITANSSGNVVIAAPASGYALDVTGTGRFTNDLFLKGDTRVLYFQNSAGTGYPAYISAANSTSLIISANQNIPLDLRTNDATRIYITSGGYIGMGTTTPSSRLQVEVAAESPATGQIALIAKTSNGINDIFRWYDGATQLGVFKNSGSVGIGTTSPSYLLDIQSTSATLRIKNTTAPATGGTSSLLFEGINNYSGTSQSFINSIQAGNSGATQLVFGTSGTTDATATERMRITSGGNVNINTTSAYTSRLNVQAAAANRPAIKAGFGASAGNGYWILGDNYTLDESLMSIGIDYSSGGLVLGSALAPSTTTSGAFISTQAQFGGYGSAMKLGTGGDITFYNGTQNSVIAAGNAKTASAAMTILQNGNVGIGTTSPSNKLEVDGGSSAVTLRVSTTNTGAGVSALVLSNSSKSAFNDGVKIAHGGGYTNVTDLAGTNIMTWDMSNSRVGIGTTSPESILHLSQASAGGEGAFVFIDNPAASTLGNKAGIRFATNTGASFSGYGSFIEAINTDAGNGAEALTFGTWNGSSRGERMRITSSGFVLIGTTAGDPVASNVAGIAFEGTYGSGKFSRSNNACIDGNRIGSDGELIRMYRGGTQVGNISVTGSSTSYNTSSDYRLKEDFKSINGLEIVNKIKVYDYKWKANDSRMDGVLAHELAEVLPYAVQGIKDGEQMQSVDYSKIVPVLVASIKELSAKVTALESK